MSKNRKIPSGEDDKFKESTEVSILKHTLISLIFVVINFRGFSENQSFKDI